MKIQCLHSLEIGKNYNDKHIKTWFFKKWNFRTLDYTSQRGEYLTFENFENLCSVTAFTNPFDDEKNIIKLR